MTFAVPKFFASVRPADLAETLSGLFSRNQAELEHLVPIKRPYSEAAPEVSRRVDQIRYEQMLEREVDRQLLSEVEREDRETLDRVREALYAE
ncbi:cell division protein FtsA [Pseudooctadecabacter sp.]|uniref:cell division protein FtsA n=1 Tax=Pseudooctadecabacter sp. TaxID=1966338 RepID=UPI0025E8A7C0|nr:cell division protein FtsA [Pseudooctadecabacter sp.]